MEERFDTWDTDAPLPDMEAELKKMRRNLRRRNGKIILTSVILVLAILTGAVKFLVPALEKQFWDPTICTYLEDVTDLELTMVTYNELFGQGRHLMSVDVRKEGFAAYSLDCAFLSWEGLHRLTDISFQDASITQSTFQSPTDFWLEMVEGVFVRNPSASYVRSYQEREKLTRKTLAELPEYVEVYASVTFPEDVSMEELQQLTYRYSQSAKFLWAPVRLGEENRFPCGIHLTEYRSERYAPNFWKDTAYPELFADRWNWSSTDMEQHMYAMLRFCRDQYRNGTGFAPGEKESPEYYDQALNYLAENGVKAYGSYVIATPQTLLKMMDVGDVSYVYLLDAWIGI